MVIKKIQGDLCHNTLRDKIKQKYAFNPNEDFESQKRRAKEKLIELLGMEDIIANKADDAQFEIEENVKCDGYTRIRFTFQSEIDSIVPCYLLIPDGDKEKYPLAITLQGHSTGFHNSIGVPKSENDIKYITHSDFAIQAVNEGYVALAIEQRCMGERITSRHTWLHTCEFPTINAIMMGRTSIGERIFDISCAIDQMVNFDKVDTSKILITGNSGGGTATFYAACLEDRISYAIPSCAFCSFKSSIMEMHHCACNYIPNIYKWFEMHDVAVALAPKKALFIAGNEDPIFPIHGVKDSYSIVEKIYQSAGAKDACKLVITPKGHFWCKDIIWEEIKKGVMELGW